MKENGVNMKNIRTRCLAETGTDYNQVIFIETPSEVELLLHNLKQAP